MKRLVCILLLLAPMAYAQLWSGILNAPSGSAANSQLGIDWTIAGTGGVPSGSWTQYGSTITSTGSDQTSQIQTALTACSGVGSKYVLLAAGTFSLSGTVNVPANCVLRGSGPEATILSGIGTGTAPITMGTSSPGYSPITINSGATAGSASLVLASNTGVSAGKYLIVTELNDTSFVTINGSESPNCYYCDGWGSNPWTDAQSHARGQIVEVQSITGSGPYTVTISPALYSAYSHTPIAVSFTAQKYAGVENLQIFGNNTYSQAAIYGKECAYCWVTGVKVNYADGNGIEFDWSYRVEVRDNYVSGTFTHGGGNTEGGTIMLAFKTSASLVQNNIHDRVHVPFQINEGAAGNVVAYNSAVGEFGDGAAAYNWALGGIQFHDAHPQFNLLEGNVVRKIWMDSIHGSSSNTTEFRNWTYGTSLICAPVTDNTRATVDCTAPPAQSPYQESRTIETNWLSRYSNPIGNVTGSAAQAALVNGSTLSQVAVVQYPSTVSYDHTAYNFAWGYGESDDDGTGSGCDGGVTWGPCHSTDAYTTSYQQGNYTYTGNVTTWIGGTPVTLPPSFYLAAKPGWWGQLPWPSIGPDVTGGSGPGGHASLTASNAAMNCYLNLMGGNANGGGIGSPLAFNPVACYGSTLAAPVSIFGIL